MNLKNSKIYPIIWVIIIYCSGYYYSITTVGSKYTVYALALGIMLSIVFLGDGTKIKKRDFLWLMVLVSAIVISDACAGVLFSFTGIKQILTLLFAYIVASRVKWADFKITFVRLMVVVAIMAVVGQIIILSPYVASFPTIFNYNNEQYISGLFFATLKYQYSGISSRMQGFFWEPGLFATYIFLALLFMQENMFRKRRNYIMTMILFSVCIVLSRSGAGLLLLPLGIITKIADKQQGELKSRYTIAFLVIIVIVFGSFVFSQSQVDDFLERYLYSKLFDVENISTGSRLSAALVDLQVFGDNFFVGVGPSKYISVISSNTASFANATSGSSGTSTLTTYLASYGLLGLLYVYNWIRGIVLFGCSKGLVAGLATASAIVIILFKEPHGSLLLMNCIFMYFWTNKPFININEVENHEIANCNY